MVLMELGASSTCACVTTPVFLAMSVMASILVSFINKQASKTWDVKHDTTTGEVQTNEQSTPLKFLLGQWGYQGNKISRGLMPLNAFLKGLGYFRVPEKRYVNSVCAGIRCEKSYVKFSNVYLLINDVVFFTKAFIDYAKCGALWN